MGSETGVDRMDPWVRRILLEEAEEGDLCQSGVTRLMDRKRVSEEDVCHTDPQGRACHG